MNIKELWPRFRGGAVAVSACMLALGAVMVIWPGISALAVCVILGVLCLASGVYELIRYFRLGLAGVFFRFDLALGLLGILAGLLLLFHPQGAAVLLPIAAGLYIIVGSVFDIQAAVEMRRLGMDGWGLSLALGIISTVFAVFLLANPFTGASALMIFAGISLIVSAAQNFYLIHGVSRAIRASRRDDVIEVSWEDMG